MTSEPVGATEHAHASRATPERHPTIAEPPDRRDAAPAANHAIACCRRLLPGLWVVGVIALAGTFVAEHSGGPQLLYALFFGIAFHFLADQPNCRPGIDLAASTLLRLAVALLGARITVAKIAELGWWPIVIVCVATPATVVCGIVCARLLGRSRAEGVLAGGAVGICGASAALAIAAVLPHNAHNQRLALLTVAGVTGLSTVAMILYPTLATMLGFDAAAAGIFLGATIHDVAQVVGAGYTLSPRAGDVATFVKLLRVALLLPLVALLWFVYRGRRTAPPGAAPPLPLFLVGFAFLVCVNSLELLPPAAADGLSEVSRWCLVMAIAAIGTKTSLQQLAHLGWRPIALLLSATAFLALLVLGLLWLER